VKKADPPKIDAGDCTFQMHLFSVGMEKKQQGVAKMQSFETDEMSHTNRGWIKWREGSRRNTSSPS